MLDMQREHLLTLTQAAKILPGRPNLATLWRWRTKGVRNGIKLETAMSGGKRFTSLEAIKRFQERVTAAADHVPAAVTTPRQREREFQQAERRAEELGI
jgi:hypothetical protein